jgi:hypothetical protein
MPCRPLPNGGFACGRGRRQARPCQCGRASSAPRLCDHPVADGRTCDAPICTACSVRVAPDRDLCRAHAPAGEACAVAMRGELYSDPRFLLASWAARAVYQQLLDGRDAAGDWLAPRGRLVVDAVAATVRCARDEASVILAELESSGLVRLESDRACLLVASGRGARGGQSAAERKRTWRAGASPRHPFESRGQGTGTGNGDRERIRRQQGNVQVTDSVTTVVTGSGWTRRGHGRSHGRCDIA